MRLGTTYRYSSKNRDAALLTVDGLPNFFHATNIPNRLLVEAKKGINPISKIPTPDGLRRPAILIRSSPHKVGSSITPWQDIFDTDNGHIRYYGDNKDPDKKPWLASGNEVLLEQYDFHKSPYRASRMDSVPLIFFEAVPVGSRKKGNLLFHGLGILERAELITQKTNQQGTFTNYVFDCLIFDLSSEQDELDWEWIVARNDPNLDNEATLSKAPSSWKNWIREGSSSIEKYRRKVSKLHTKTRSDQEPPKGSAESKALSEIYDFYSGRNSEFEVLASEVTARILGQGGNRYMRGWITPSTSDGGVDFIGRLDVGSALVNTKLVVLGQAKCERIGSSTSGTHIARTVARLKRGWIGVYVTTSYFSEPVQREVIEDQYPLVMVDGYTLAKEVLKMAHEAGGVSVSQLLVSLKNEFDQAEPSLRQSRRPEDILYSS